MGSDKNISEQTIIAIKNVRREKIDFFTTIQSGWENDTHVIKKIHQLKQLPTAQNVNNN